MTPSTENKPTPTDVEPINVGQLRQILAQPHHRVDERTLHIVIQSPGHVGGTPSVAVEQALMGFDWDSKKLLLYPTKPLTALTPEQVEAIHHSVKEGQSWHAFEQYRKYRDNIATLKSTLSAQQQCLQTLLGQDNLTDDQRTAIQAALSTGAQATQT